MVRIVTGLELRFALNVEKRAWFTGLRTVPTNTEVFLRSLLLCRKSRS